MAKVKTLREDVYKKIAAGEVVERPLSVVKELVENAIDAGADSIHVEVMEGGKRMIRVTDNGSGFEPEDIETAFKNHSTSKISELTDFDQLDTLGFRGEALPSILEVSKIEVKTSDTTDGSGVYVLMEGGVLLDSQQIACNRGTSITVKDLFYNFPVRRKFLKTERTELNQITAFLEPMALVNFDKSFALSHNGKTVFSYKKAAQLQERIYQVFGKEFLDNLQEVTYESENYRVHGFISKLNTGVSVKKHQYFFVNRRSVREKTMIAAVNNSFNRYLEKHRSPVSILLLQVPPNEIDVNIHPMKLEIKFVDSSRIFQFIKRAIDSCFNHGDIYIEDLDAFSGAAGSGYRDRPYNNRSGNTDGYANTYEHESSYHPDSQRGGKQPAMDDFQQTHLFSGHLLDRDEFVIIGQYKNSYIIVEKDGQLLIVDQHNAQERVNFDALKNEFQQSKVESITPLFPVIIELTPSESGLMGQKKLDVLARAGFRLEPLAGNAFDIKSFPHILGEKNIKEAVRTVLHMKEQDDPVNFEDSILAEIACKSAIKINHKLYPDQMKTIVGNLFNSSNAYFCPHKRPIIIDFSLEKIEKMMKRR